MNVLLYSFTRRIFLYERSDTIQDIRRSRYGNKSSVMRSADGGIELDQQASRYRELPSPVASTDNIVMKGKEGGQNSVDPKDGVVMQTSWEIQVEEVRDSKRAENQDGMGHRTFVTF